MIPLSRLPLNRAGKILSLSAGEPLKSRLMDLGFVPGSRVIPLFQAPLGDPRAYWVCETVIALRQRDAAGIAVEES